MPEQKAHRTRHAARSTGFFIYNARFTRHEDELFQSRLHFRFFAEVGAFLMPERIISQKRKKGIAMINFAQIKQAVTTRQAAEAYGLSVNSRGMCRCPFHNDHTPSMKVDETFYCFGCGAVGDVITFTARLFGISAGSAARKLEGSGFWNRRRRCGCHPEIPVTAKIRGLGVSRPGGSAGIQSAARKMEVQTSQSG